jgi:hypothetical protein
MGGAGSGLKAEYDHPPLIATLVTIGNPPDADGHRAR